MKTYFAKYLPVEGEIQDGDTIAFEGNMNDIQIVGKTVIPPVKWSDKKVKLFLCSRDIQTGDEFIHDDGYGNKSINICTRTLPTLIEGATKFLSTHPTGSYQEGMVDIDVYKKIGEISPEAIWVKENDQFEEDEVSIYYPKKYNKIPFDNGIVIIKCSQCQTFH